MHPTFLAPLLSKAINAYIALDPEMPPKIQQLAGKIVLIEVSGLNLELELLFTATGIKVLEKSTTQADTTIRGTPMALFKMGLGPTNASAFLGGKATIAGDLELGQTVKTILDGMEIDWEEQAAHWVGDVPAHQLGNLLRTTKDWATQTAGSLRLNLTEYLQEEKPVLVSRSEHDHFCHEVSQLRNDVERICARLALLERGET